jgi:hypothetical protein
VAACQLILASLAAAAAFLRVFRFVEDITGVGDLSGDKTDLSCNVYAQVGRNPVKSHQIKEHCITLHAHQNHIE